ncbi:probable maltase isoform X2 [Microplitis demolitor]|uniref:probable maltase isoform X2 n=1 Tax=Microplitis demolitor TaxID=69319 RepID=UPI0004CDBF5E|nr:probable maltase isoform X2 [Microplitis demolitor]
MSAKCLLILLSSFIFLIGVCSGNPEPEWWETAQIYQIWTRAFKDSDGDGEGDLQGILSKLDYIKDIGVDTICLSPIFSSPLNDFGYDISNYTDINPIYGDMEDFDQLVEEIHKRDIKIILEVVPNYSSSEHEWFEASVNRIDPYSDYYIWANGSVDGNGTKTPPNNLTSMWNYDKGSSWTWNEVRGQWYYHKFKETKPNLNLHSEDVVKEIMEILDFWLEKGVDGFQISNGGFFYEDPEEEDEPDEETVSGVGNAEVANLISEIREHTENWTETNNSTSKLLLIVSEDSDENLISYYGDDSNLGVVPFNFHLITNVSVNDGADEIKTLIENWLNTIPDNHPTNWPISHQDGSRIATRLGEERAEAMLVLTMLLPGQVYSYYGDEIGMKDAELPWNGTINPTPRPFTLTNIVELSKYAGRSPMQWDNSTCAGFSVNETVYFPINEDYVTRNVESQLEDALSTLNTYKTLAYLRREMVFQQGHWSLETINNDKVLFLRRYLENQPEYLVLINFGIEEEVVNVTALVSEADDLKIVLSTNERSLIEPDSVIETVNIEAYDAVVIVNYINETDVTPQDNQTSTEDNLYLESTPYSLDVDSIDNTPDVTMTAEEIDESDETVDDIATEFSESTAVPATGMSLIVNPITTLLSTCCILMLFK